MKRSVIAFVLLLTAAFGGHAANAAPRDGAVDLATKPVQLQAVRQDPLNHQMTNLQLPANAVPAQVRDLFTTPVGKGLNTFWSGTAAPFLCNLAQQTFNGQGGSGFNLYNTTCALAQAGRATATQQGDAVILDYYLPGNVLEAYITTPITCAPDHGTIFCPTDPKVSLTADFELQATIETPGAACDAHIDPFIVQAHNVTLDSQNYVADIGIGLNDLWASITGTDYLTTAENFIESGVDQLNNNSVAIQQAITGKLATFTSSLCNSIIPSLPGASDLWLLNGSVDPNQGIVFQLVDEPPLPSLFAPTLTAGQVNVVAGRTVQLSGQNFPAGGGTVTLTLGDVRLGTATLSAQGSFSTTVTIPANTAPGNEKIDATAGTAHAQTTIQVVAPGAAATLVVSWQGQTFTKVDTDNPFTLSGTGLAPGPVTIYLDSITGARLGTATVGGDGTFSQNFQVSAGQINNRGGQQHTLLAVQNGNVVASVTVTFYLPEIIH